ncbi:MAG: DUF4124 domain-containing protein [Gammaproteobacteria bacterium]
MMNTNITRATCLMLALALLASQEALAVKVYQWTDEEGVVHYSDTPPPEDAVAEISEIELFDTAGSTADPDEYSIVNQLERMTAWRRQAEEDRRAWKQLQLEEERLALEQKSYQPPDEASTDTYYPVAYYPYSYYPNSYYPRAFNYSYRGNFPRHMNRHGRHFPDKHFGIGNRGHHGQFTTGYYSFR